MSYSKYFFLFNSISDFISSTFNHLYEEDICSTNTFKQWGSTMEGGKGKYL